MIRKVLTSYLRTIHPRVYFQSAPTSAVYPYIVFDFPTDTDDGEFQEFVVVDVDGWDQPSNGDTATIENLMASINGNGTTGLNKKSIVEEDFAVSFFLDRKLPLIDPDQSIKRRKYVYQARLYKKE